MLPVDYYLSSQEIREIYVGQLKIAYLVRSINTLLVANVSSQNCGKGEEEECDVREEGAAASFCANPQQMPPSSTIAMTRVCHGFV